MGKDGLIRDAIVKLGSRNRQSTRIRRPIQLLYALEVHDNSDDSNAPQPTRSNQVAGVPNQQTTTRRSSRIAASHSDDRRRALLLQSEEDV